MAGVVHLKMSKIAQDEIASTMLLGKKFDLSEVKKMIKNIGIEKDRNTLEQVFLKQKQVDIDNTVTTGLAAKEVDNIKKRSFAEMNTCHNYIYMNDEKASIPGFRPYDDTVMKIYRNEITKKIRMDNRAVTLARYSLRELQKQDGVPVTINAAPVFEYFEKKCSGCSKDTCALHLIPMILADPLKCHSVMNHIIRCSNTMCPNISCFVIKNIIKLNIINGESGVSAATMF